MKSGFRFILRNKIKNNVKLNRRVIDFNKEIFIGEIGALLGAPIFGFISSLIARNPGFIAFLTLFGSVLGGSTSWLIARVHDEKRYKNFSARKVGRDISVFTPIAFLISILASYPTVFLVTHSLFMKEHVSFFSSLIGEAAGFCVFLVLINAYRMVLGHRFNRLL